MNAPTHLDVLHRPIPPEFTTAAAALFGDRWLTSASALAHYGESESPYPPTPPDAVAIAHSTNEVAALAALCHAHRVPLIPYGAGSSLEGHTLAIEGGGEPRPVANERNRGNQRRRSYGHGPGGRVAQATERCPA